jgi:hypothetical protein
MLCAFISATDPIVFAGGGRVAYARGARGLLRSGAAGGES